MLSIVTRSICMTVYIVHVAPRNSLLCACVFSLAVPLSLDGEKSVSDVRNMIHKLYTSLNVEKHQV